MHLSCVSSWATYLAMFWGYHVLARNVETPRWQEQGLFPSCDQQGFCYHRDIRSCHMQTPMVIGLMGLRADHPLNICVLAPFEEFN